MRIALFGYGRMGKLIESIALERGHTIAARIDKDSVGINPEQIDVAIDFSTPESAFTNIAACLDLGIPVISGTTGWLEQYDNAKALCLEKGGAFLYASNFSLGVNLFFALNETFARLMKGQEAYQPKLEEIHHIHKVDAPSGTAITLAEAHIEAQKLKGWILDAETENQLPIRSFREGEVPGTHRISYHSEVDSLQIEHVAHSRKGFALGAVIAAEWLPGKKGVFGMKDVLNLS